MAGTSGWRYRDYFVYGLIGTLLWAIAFSLVGYYASQNIDDAVRIAGRLTFAIGALAFGGVATYLLVRYLRRAGAETRRRFAIGALAMVAALGLAVLVVYAVIVGAHPGPTTLDSSAFADAADLRTDSLVDVAKVLTGLGSGWVVAPLTLLAAIVLARRGHRTEAVVLLAATAISFVAVQVLKASIDRPRPPGALVGTHTSSYPSGHATHAVFYVWIALVAVVLLRPRATRATMLIGIGLAITLIVGLTRVYLRAHYLSDVLGGWGLGVATFAGCALVAMVVTRLRQNHGDAAAPG